MVFASNFNVIIGSEDVNYEVGGFTDRIEDNGWTNKGLEDCSFDIIGLVGLDYYSFQNAVGIELKAHETYAEHIYGNVTFGFMAHRVLDTIEANIFIR